MNTQQISVTFRSAGGDTWHTDAVAGQSAMEVAVRHNVPGIIGECGGTMACATCHVVVPEEFVPDFDPPEVDEADMVEFLDGACDRSRLACQLKLAPDHADLVLDLP
ncbi:putative 2Fe-2S ferredoxin [Gordonia paraffinivorans NBRC 108238]|uniref:2Fe-2S ferredoxin n=1 Tax=Gordonia paraffinivorans NBRC 108238 TaxID=1223543 RepID=A0ABQ0IM74_9ACTN|nr:2Fe-2S iron-sulfur cluster-binding protein [Gordonia paraffinivorans]GAC84652.1 putative 2Fe-2S ferredoxin [Gordonia paraffinivorans NBRC 108238]